MDHCLPPTSPDLLKDGTKPYFVWWTDVTIGELRQKLAGADAEQRAYWLGAVLREANTRDVWLFTTASEIRDAWPRLIRYLGTSRQRWA